MERQLCQKLLAKDHESHIRDLMEKIGIGLNNLGFAGRQELLRLLVEKVCYDGSASVIEIQTNIPLNEQLHPIRRGG